MPQVSDQKPRFFENQIFTSLYTPYLQAKIDLAFTYIGNVEFNLKGVACVDRHIFIDVRQKHLHRMIIFQFEGFLENNNKTYSFQLDHPIRLGGETYGHNNYFFSIIKDITDDPEAETDHTVRYLKSKGIQVEDEQMTSRFARIIGSDKRNELIIFYHENIKDVGHTLDAIVASDDLIKEEYKEIAQELTKRSLQSFNIIDPSS